MNSNEVLDPNCHLPPEPFGLIALLVQSFVYRRVEGVPGIPEVSQRLVLQLGGYDEELTQGPQESRTRKRSYSVGECIEPGGKLTKGLYSIRPIAPALSGPPNVVVLVEAVPGLSHPVVLTCEPLDNLPVLL